MYSQITYNTRDNENLIKNDPFDWSNGVFRHPICIVILVFKTPKVNENDKKIEKNKKIK